MLTRLVIVQRYPQFWGPRGEKDLATVTPPMLWYLVSLGPNLVDKIGFFGSFCSGVFILDLEGTLGTYILCSMIPEWLCLVVSGSS